MKEQQLLYIQEEVRQFVNFLLKGRNISENTRQLIYLHALNLPHETVLKLLPVSYSLSRKVKSYEKETIQAGKNCYFELLARHKLI